MYVYSVGVFMYQLTINELPAVICALFVRNNTIHSYSTRQSNLFHLPLTRTLFAQKNITFTGPKFWNDLPIGFTESTSLYSFKRKLKCHLLSNYAILVEEAWCSFNNTVDVQTECFISLLLLPCAWWRTVAFTCWDVIVLRWPGSEVHALFVGNVCST